MFHAFVTNTVSKILFEIYYLKEIVTELIVFKVHFFQIEISRNLLK